MEISAPRYRAELHRLRGVQGEQRVLIGSRPQDIVHAGRRYAQGFWLFFLLPRSDCEKNLLRLVKLGEKKYEKSPKFFICKLICHYFKAHFFFTALQRIWKINVAPGITVFSACQLTRVLPIKIKLWEIVRQMFSDQVINPIGVELEQWLQLYYKYWEILKIK